MLLFSTINDIQLRFATPILRKTWPGASRHNSALKELIIHKSQESGSVAFSNRGGWQSRDDLMTWGGECISALNKWIHACVYQIHYTFNPDTFSQYLAAQGGQLKTRVTAWANINRKGDWNSLHNHPACHWSGVYYVQAPKGSGQIALFDPRPNINMLNTGREALDIFVQAPQTIEPEEGLILIFPSWLQHQVQTHEQEIERISIAFNLRFVFD